MVEKDITVGMRVRNEDGVEGNVVEVDGSTVIVALSESGPRGLRSPRLDAKLGRKVKYWNYDACELSPVIDSGWILGAWYDWNQDASDPKYRFQQIVEIDERGYGYRTMFPPHTEYDFAPYPFDKYSCPRISGPCAIGVIPWDDVAKVADKNQASPAPDVSGDYSKADMKKLLEMAAGFVLAENVKEWCSDGECHDCPASSWYHNGYPCNHTKGGSIGSNPAVRAWFAEFIRVYGGEGTGSVGMPVREGDTITFSGVVSSPIYATVRPALSLALEPFTKVSYRPLSRCGVHIYADE